MCNVLRKEINWLVSVLFDPVVTTIHIYRSVVSLFMAQGVPCFYGTSFVFYNCNQQMHTIVIRFTIRFLKTINFYMFRTSLAHNQRVH